MIQFLKKRWADILLGLFLLLMLIPQTRMPIQVFLQRIIAFSPTEVSPENRKVLRDYDLIFENEDRKHFNLENDRGEVVVINFWATWCPPCVAEMPEFSNLYKEYQGRVKFYFITQDDWDFIQNFEEKRNYQLPYYRLVQPSTELAYTSLPTTYFINRNREIIIDKIGVADWNSAKFRAILDTALNQ